MVEDEVYLIKRLYSRQRFIDEESRRRPITGRAHARSSVARRGFITQRL